MVPLYKMMITYISAQQVSIIIKQKGALIEQYKTEKDRTFL